jgi:competence protein ComEC
VLHREIPFLRIIVPLCLGIITGLTVGPGRIFIAIMLIISFFLYILSLFYNRQLTNRVFGLAIFTCFFAAGLILLYLEQSRITTLEPEQSLFISTLSGFPEEKENTYMITVDLNSIQNDGVKKPVRGSMVLYHPKDSSISQMLPGDVLVVRCTPVEITNRGNPCEFDYRSYMASRGIRYYAFTGKQDLLYHADQGNRKLRYKALIIRERIIKMYEERGIKGERLALVSAITLGQKRLLDQDQKQIFINAGIMHIMAVSGLHAVILSLFIFNILFFLKGKFNILRIAITLVLLWGFAFVTGLTPSVLRATFMFTFLQAGNLMNRRPNSLNSVLASAFILIVIKPTVITDAGFLLSYAAVIYIIAFYQDFYTLLHFKKWFPDKIWQSAAVTIIAQAGTLPLTIMLFNRFPVYFILTNIIIVPLSSLLIIIGCLVPLTYPFVAVSEFLAAVMNWLTGATEFLTRTAASLPSSTINNIGLTTIECIALTIAVSLLISFLLKREPVRIVYPLIAFIIFTTEIFLKRTENGIGDELIVYNLPAFTTTGIRSGNTLHILSMNDSIPAEVIRHAATRGLKIDLLKHGCCPIFLKAGKNNILITDSLRKTWLKETKPGIVVLTGRFPFMEKSISLEDLPDKIIISPEATPRYKVPSSPENYYGRCEVINVRKSGAVILRL